MAKTFLEGIEGDYIAPSIFLNSKESGVNFNAVKPLEQTTRAFVESQGYQLATTDDVEIRDMGQLGEGLFAATDIAKGTVIGVCGGTVFYQFSSPTSAGIYDRSCTSEEVGKSESNGAYYHYTSIRGTGSCSADKIQHAFATSEMQKVLQHHTELLENAATPNIQLDSIKTGYDFSVILLIAERPIKKNEIFLTNYGPAYVFGQTNNMEVVSIFNKDGQVIGALKANRKKLSLSVVTEEADVREDKNNLEINNTAKTVEASAEQKNITDLSCGFFRPSTTQQESQSWDAAHPSTKMIIIAACIPVIGWVYLVYLLYNALSESYCSNNSESSYKL